MRYTVAAIVVAVTSGSARADCELAVELRGAIVDAVQREAVAASPTPQVFDFELPAGARVVDVALRGKRGASTAVAVPASFEDQKVADASVIGADPVLAFAVGGSHYRAIVQPSADDATLVVRWTAVAAIADGTIALALPARAGTSCVGKVHAAAGPGATITHVKIDGADTLGATASFSLGARGAAIAAELAFARPRPVAWVQDEALGDGSIARAITVAAPRVNALASVRRAVFVVDTSRSMKLVGRAKVASVVRAIASALPAGATIDTIAFDRAPEQLLGGWKPVNSQVLAALDGEILRRPELGGSDLAAALALAHDALAAGEPAIVVAITDGMLGDVDGEQLAQKLGDARAVDFYPIVIDPDGMHAPAHDALAGAVARIGGAYIELDAGTLDAARAAEWIAPAWQLEPGAQLRAGEGATAIAIVRGGAPALAASDEHGKVPLAVGRAPATSVVGQLALARADHVDARVRARHPFLDGDHAFAVLASSGRVAANRRAMIAGGGPYTRIVAADDPPNALERVAPAAAATTRVATIDRELLQHVFELQLQPMAYQCFQRALGRSAEIEGTVQFGIELARGEVTHVVLAGTGDAAFDSCLVDAAYALVPPLPNPAFDADDRTIANYPLTFSVREAHPIIIAGDADSDSPLDIDAIRGGVPARPRKVHVPPKDAATPLGPLRP